MVIVIGPAIHASNYPSGGTMLVIEALHLDISIHICAVLVNISLLPIHDVAHWSACIFGKTLSPCQWLMIHCKIHDRKLCVELSYKLSLKTEQRVRDEHISRHCLTEETKQQIYGSRVITWEYLSNEQKAWFT